MPCSQCFKWSSLCDRGGLVQIVFVYVFGVVGAKQWFPARILQETIRRIIGLWKICLSRSNILHPPQHPQRNTSYKLIMDLVFAFTYMLRSIIKKFITQKDWGILGQITQPLRLSHIVLVNAFKTKGLCGLWFWVYAFPGDITGVNSRVSGCSVPLKVRPLAFRSQRTIFKLVGMRDLQTWRTLDWCANTHTRQTCCLKGSKPQCPNSECVTGHHTAL